MIRKAFLQTPVFITELLKRAEHCYFIYNSLNEELEWSDSTARILGWSKVYLDSKHTIWEIHPDDYELIANAIKDKKLVWNQVIRFRAGAQHYTGIYMELFYDPVSGFVLGIVPAGRLQIVLENKRLVYLKECIKNQFLGFKLYYQPIVFSENGELYGCEALLRWNCPEQGEVPIEDLIQELDTEGLLYEVGNWVIDSAIKQCAIWSETIPNFQMSINVAASQFEESSFRHFIIDKLAEYHVKPSLITLELTENNQIQNAEYLSREFDFLRGQGIKIALDDFGTGYDSLSIFRMLSADELKIERSFIERLSYHVADQKLVRQIINLCDSLQMFVCVEGVETKEMEQIIRHFGARLCQGYYYSAPLPAEVFTQKYIYRGITTRNCIVGKVPTSIGHSLVYGAMKPTQVMKMELVVENAYAGIFQVALDHEFTFVSCNEGYRRILGYTAKEMEEKFKNKALNFVHPNDMEYVNKEIRSQLECGDTVTIEFRIVRADGSSVWILGTGNVVKTENGMASLIVVIIENDTLKKKSLSIKRERDQYRKILQRLPTGIKCVRYDDQFTVEYISPSFLSILGFSESEVQEVFGGKYINMVLEEDREMLMSDILEQVKVSNVIHLRYRSYSKVEKYIWLETISRLYGPDKDGIQRCYSTVVNMTDSSGLGEDKQTISLANRYQEAIQWWGEVLFEFNVKSETISYSDNYNVIFERDPQPNLCDEIAFIHPKDRGIFEAALFDFKKGLNRDSLELRIMKGNGSYIWCSFLFNKIDCIGEEPVSVIGRISDITQDKEEKELLIKKSRHDLLTGVLNKGTMEMEIRRVLREEKAESNFAFWMMDIDHFKNVNDTYGHVFGDELLRETAKRIRNTFAEGTIIGRAGGDEFIVFMKYEGILEVLEKKLKEVHEILCQPFRCHEQTYCGAISIGISRCPQDSRDFGELYHYADSALYQVKDSGRNDYCIYHLFDTRHHIRGSDNK